MTPKQVERLQTKISNIKRTLAAEKRKFGCYDDSRGLRYLPTKFFIQLQDYKGGLIYLRWFSKNFPDDGGFPDFLFEWTIQAAKRNFLTLLNGWTTSFQQTTSKAAVTNTWTFKNSSRPKMTERHVITQ